LLTSAHIDQTNLHPTSQGNNELFHQLFNDYWTRVYNTAFMLIKVREMAEDITQEVFMKLWQSRQSLHTVENPENFLFVTTRNLTYNRMKRIKTEDAYINYLLQNHKIRLASLLPLLHHNYLQALCLFVPFQQRKHNAASFTAGF
jgi:DNA-directed RNA polymerase specialized sigma24 family protein